MHATPTGGRALRSYRGTPDLVGTLHGLPVPVWGKPGRWDSLGPLHARVAERQTRWLQVPVSERAWGVKSPLAHVRLAPGPRIRGFVICGPPGSTSGGTGPSSRVGRHTAGGQGAPAEAPSLGTEAAVDAFAPPHGPPAHGSPSAARARSASRCGCPG